MAWLAPPADDAAYWIRRARVPARLAGGGDGALRDVRIVAGRIAEVEPSSAAVADRRAGVDADGGLLVSAPVDCHAHLDKGHIGARSPAAEGDLAAAIAAAHADKVHWSREDLALRMAFSLACAYAHGTRAIRTHIDHVPAHPTAAWAIARELRAEWRGRIELQLVPLAPIDAFDDEAYARATVRLAADSGAALGAACLGQPDLRRRIERLFALADGAGLDLDFHADEGLDPALRSLELIARVALERRFPGRIVCGHCCALAAQDAATVGRTLDLVAAAGITVVSLPLANAFLQDRAPGRTPRLRGVTLVRELAARAIPVAIASDNHRDPFFAYGDLDLVEALGFGARFAHLADPARDWIESVTAAPAAAMRLAWTGRVETGAPADLVLFSARDSSELFARPQADRAVIRAGRWLDAALPDFRALDAAWPRDAMPAPDYDSRTKV